MKQETFIRVVKYGTLSLVALVISPIIFAIVKGVVGQDTQARVKDVYQPTVVGYDNLGQAGVPTVSTQALFVTRTYESTSMKSTLAKLRSCMKKNLPELKDATGTHAKWQDVQANDDGKWPVYELP